MQAEECGSLRRSGHVTSLLLSNGAAEMQSGESEVAQSRRTDQKRCEVSSDSVVIQNSDGHGKTTEPAEREQRSGA